MENNKLLVAVDTSENSERAIHYISYILKNRDDFQIGLLYVHMLPDKDIFPDEESWKLCCAERERKGDAFLKKCEKTLLEKGFKKENIKQIFYYMEAGSVAQKILEIQEKNGYGTIVVGRRGISKAEEFLFGSVSNKIIHYAKNSAVWVVE